MRFFLSKEGVRYHEVVSYSEFQDVYSLLILFAISKPPCTLSNPPLTVPTRPLRSHSMKNFSLLGTPLTMSSKSSQNHFLTSSLKLTYGAYTLITFKTKSPKTNLIIMILSHCLLTATTPFLRLLSIRMPIPFLLRSFPVYHNLKPVFSTSLAF
jgi:hypothetical protein